jgi:hypothetical protein
VTAGISFNAAGKANEASAVPLADAMNLRRLNSVVMDISNLENCGPRVALGV